MDDKLNPTIISIKNMVRDKDYKVLTSTVFDYSGNEYPSYSDCLAALKDKAAKLYNTVYYKDSWVVYLTKSNEVVASGFDSQSQADSKLTELMVSWYESKLKQIVVGHDLIKQETATRYHTDVNIKNAKKARLSVIEIIHGDFKGQKFITGDDFYYDLKHKVYIALTYGATNSLKHEIKSEEDKEIFRAIFGDSILREIIVL